MDETKEERRKRLRKIREDILKQKRIDEAPIVECACGCGETFKELRTNVGTLKRFAPGHNSKNDAHERRARVKDAELTPEQQIARDKKEARYLKKWQNAAYIKCACGCEGELKEYDKYGRKATYINGHNARKFDDPKEFLRNYNDRNRAKHQKYKQLRIRQQKGELLLYKGGKCSVCGIKYDGENASIFDLHHRIPAEKEFNISAAFNKTKLAYIYKEIEKCDVLCANCHRLLHNEKY
ncbi:hypothetical protein JZU46_03150 [bacterium]|nr:hypothetical protein [bacterium]